MLRMLAWISISGLHVDLLVSLIVKWIPFINADIRHRILRAKDLLARSLFCDLVIFLDFLVMVRQTIDPMPSQHSTGLLKPIAATHHL